MARRCLYSNRLHVESNYLFAQKHPGVNDLYPMVKTLSEEARAIQIEVNSHSFYHSMAIILKLLLAPIGLLFYRIRDQIMGGSNLTPTPVPAPQIQNNSSGFHILEFHAATVGSGAIVLVVIVLVCLFNCYGYGCLRRRCKRSMMRH